MWSHTTFIKLHEECFKQLRLREINWPKLPLGGTDKAGIQTRSLTSKTMLIFCMVLCNVVKNPPASAGDLGGVGSISESRRSPGVGNGNPLQYSCLENPMDRGAWQAPVHGITKSQTRTSTHRHNSILEGLCTDHYFLR